MIVRRSSGKGSVSVDSSSGSIEKSKMNDNSDSYSNLPTVDLDALLDNVDLATDSLPPVDMPDACEKAALRYLLSSGNKKLSIYFVTLILFY